MASPSAGGTLDTVAPETHMVVMPNDEDRKPCPICGERFVDFWNDDEEEWMYKNAVMVDNTVRINNFFFDERHMWLNEIMTRYTMRPVMRMLSRAEHL